LACTPRRGDRKWTVSNPFGTNTGCVRYITLHLADTAQCPLGSGEKPPAGSASMSRSTASPLHGCSRVCPKCPSTLVDADCSTRCSGPSQRRRRNHPPRRLASRASANAPVACFPRRSERGGIPSPRTGRAPPRRRPGQTTRGMAATEVGPVRAEEHPPRAVAAVSLAGSGMAVATQEKERTQRWEGTWERVRTSRPPNRRGFERA
jgi:hypothetical protein